MTYCSLLSSSCFVNLIFIQFLSNFFFSNIQIQSSFLNIRDEYLLHFYDLYFYVYLLTVVLLHVKKILISNL